MIALPRPHLTLVKTTLPKFKPEMMALNKHSASPTQTHTPPVVLPEPRKPDVVVAVVPHDPPAPVAVSVGAPSIKPDPSPNVAVASRHESHFQTADLLSSVNAHVRQMRNVAYSTERRSIKGTILAVNDADQSKGPSVPITNGSF
jgi:hypothetical protein